MTSVKTYEPIEMYSLNKQHKLKKKQKKACKKNHRIPKRSVPRRSVKFDKKSEPVTEFDLEPIIFILGDDSEEKCEESTKVEEQKAQVVSEQVELEPAVEVVEATVLQQIAVVEQQMDSANSSISSSKKSKKAKKAKSAASAQAKTGLKSSNNKENMQMKTLLLNEVKKCGVFQNGSTNNKRFEFSSNKNQMERNNKICFSMRNVNIQQRKYHKLQQPSFSFNIQQF